VQPLTLGAGVWNEDTANARVTLTIAELLFIAEYLLKLSQPGCPVPFAKAQVIVALRAYFDESGTHWGGPMACDVFVLCGYLAPESLWDDKTPNSFLAKWNDVMHGKPFHAKEMESNPQGPEVKLALANLVRKSSVIGVEGAIHIPSY